MFDKETVAIKKKNYVWSDDSIYVQNEQCINGTYKL